MNIVSYSYLFYSKSPRLSHTRILLLPLPSEYFRVIPLPCYFSFSNQSIDLGCHHHIYPYFPHPKKWYRHHFDPWLFENWCQTRHRHLTIDLVILNKTNTMFFTVVVKKFFYILSWNILINGIFVTTFYIIYFCRFNNSLNLF